MNADPRSACSGSGPRREKEIAGRDWSLWDHWFCVVATLGHDGDLDTLADSIVDAMRGNRDRLADEAKLSHLTDLRARLRDANLVAADLARPDLLADQRTTRRAREKVAGRVSLEGRACTPAMVDTPRCRLQERAWEPYAVDHGNETAWFSSARRGDVDMIEAIQLALESEHRRAVLDHEAGAALEALPDRATDNASTDR